MISIDIQGGQQLDNLDEVLRRMVMVEARNAAGEEAATELQDHFMRLDSRPNKRGWPKRNFWAQVMKTVTTQTTDPAYDIIVSAPEFWRRWKGGGPITPKTGARKLAIPATAAAYAAGRPAKGGMDLMVLVRRKGGKVQGVALAEFTTRQSKRDPSRTVRVPGKIQYWLVASTNPGADPNAAPDIGTVTLQAQRTAYAYIQAKLGGAAA